MPAHESIDRLPSQKHLIDLSTHSEGDIGLTDDELYIIIYTSVDQDNLNNLIVLAGEFTLWFNINFEGESRAEIDFREAKCEVWESTCQLASLIIDVHS